MAPISVVAAVHIDLIEDSLAEVLNCGMWRQYEHRQKFPGTAHHDTESIYIRWAPDWSTHSIFDTTDAVDYPAYKHLPRTNQLIECVLDVLNPKEVGRMMVVKLKAGGKIDEHYDGGKYAEHYSRYHVPLHSDEGNVFTCNGLSMHMQPPGVYTFSHRLLHSVRNDSLTDRIHLIMDLVPSKNKLEN